MIYTLILMVALMGSHGCATMDAIKTDPTGPVALAYYTNLTQAAVYTALIRTDTHGLEQSLPYLETLLIDNPPSSVTNRYLIEHVPAGYRGIVLLLATSARLEVMAFRAKYPDRDVSPVIGAVMEGVKQAVALRMTK